MTKFKKILTLGFLSLTICGLFATLQVAQAVDAGDVGSAVTDAWTSLASGDVCHDINDVIPIVDCGSEDVVSFIGFEGGLTPPTGEGLDTTLTRAKSAREFIVNTVNFALSFLGLIAVVIVIYGGFLYVTAAGNTEQSDKGKKAITYAVIGIVIIIASFALVNTLLTFGGGSGTDRGDGGGSTIRGAGQEGTNIGVQSIYNYSATEINASLNNFVSAYKNLVMVDTVLAKIKTIPQPKERNNNKNYFGELTSAISQIKNRSSSLSKTQMAARSFLDGWITQTSVKDLTSAEFEDGKLKEKFHTALAKAEIAEASKEDFSTTINDLIGEKKQGGKIGNVKKILGDVADAQTSNYVGRDFNSDKNLQRAFAGIDPTVPVKQIFDDAIDALDSARGLKDNPNEVQLVVNVAQSLNRLFVIVKNVEFVLVKVRASVKEGSAPLVVELNGLDSRDPTGDTIAEPRYEWEPDGTYSGERENGPYRNVDCPIKTGPTIVCTYSQPGTYVVRLKVKSSDPARVATGQAFLPITVQPSIARIVLDATAGGITEKLRSYKQDGAKWILENDLNEFHTTTSEAKNPGVKFNAASSKDGHGLDVKAYEWNFGDGTGVETTSSVIHKYKNEGKFPLRLEVTDNGNRKDRKLVNIVVGSVAARMQINKSIAEPDELIELDGSISRSDRGPIASYSWKIRRGGDNGDDVTNLQNVIEIIGDSRSPVFRAKFKTPGKYTVTLEVSDGSTNATRSETISIRSRKPRANFSVRACPENCPFPSEPGIVAIDASASFDPDKDTLLYKWTVLDDKGNEKQEDTIFSEASSPKKLLSGPDARKINLKFNKIGKYKIQLALQDDLPEDLQQTDTQEKTIEIASIVDVRFGDNQMTVGKIVGSVTQQANFIFRGTVTNANNVKIEFGDSESDATSATLDKDSRGTFSFNHSYAKAGTYMVNVTASSDEGNGENTIKKQVYVSGGDVPLAIMEASVDGEPILMDGSLFEIIRDKPIKFSAKKSVDSSGMNDADGRSKNKGLLFEWDFNDGEKSTSAEVTHSYEEISQEDKPYKVSLIVKEEADPAKIGTAEFTVAVVSKKPQVKTLSLEKKTLGNTTPVEVALTAEGAKDEDGRITNYQFWYYDPADKEQQLGITDVPVDHSTLTVETKGAEGQEHEYFFCVSVTDNENTVARCDDMFAEDDLPRLRVKNGPNKTPVASFSVDRKVAKINEEVTFISSSKDEDGRIAKYIWDLEGDGFQNDNPTELSTVAHQYKKKSPRGGYRVKLKVVDDKGAAGFSKEESIIIEPKSNPPTANFSYNVQDGRTVKFFDSSTSDTANGAKIVKWTWDFDTSKEYGCEDPSNKPAYCNGNKTDDADSTEQNPVYQYPEGGTHQVKLTVEDGDGNVSDPKTFIISLIAGAAGGDQNPLANVLRANLKTDPANQIETIGGQQKKVLRIPANSNGQNVTLFWGDSTGNIANYKVDKNIWCDSDGNGNSSDDTDAGGMSTSCQVTSAGTAAQNCWTTNYQRYAWTRDPRGAGNFTTLLTVVDRSGKTSTDTIDVIFDGQTDSSQMIRGNCSGNQSMLGGSLFTRLGTQNTILLSVVSGVILILIMGGLATFLRRGQEREI